LHDEFAIAIARNAGDRRNSAVAWSMALRQFFKPCVLAFLALAVAVGGWGYGYKLSQYLTHSDLSRASSTRLWVEHRDDASDIRAHQQHSPDKIQAPLFAGLSTPPVPHLSRELVFAEPTQSRILTFVSPLHPLRAPPTVTFSLA
jgi:hypothetical protein